MGRKKDDDHCGICGTYLFAACSGFQHNPFPDGRCYNFICDCCRNVFKVGEWIDNQWVSYEYGTNIHTLQEMLNDGWHKEFAVLSIKSVKLAMKNRKR